MADPLISLRGINREFITGGEKVAVLRDIDLDINAGEMVAIMGSSGSGKSTLMNILGCLDRASSGTYRLDGRDIGTLGPNELAELRRERFGFIFQRYQLLADLSAVENVEVPAVYEGVDKGVRRQRATELLQRLGLGDRLEHRPTQLSGGQQQRVSVARALMNGGEIILADEPTGALDSRSGADLMALLAELHRDGHTIIIVTHDPEVAAKAQRIVEIRDGKIIADSATDQAGSAATGAHPGKQARSGKIAAAIGRPFEALGMAFRAMLSHKLRTFLTMLGIVIGIASVVSVVALGQGSQQQVLENISAIGTNTIDIRPGSGFGDMRSARVRTLVASDAAAIAAEPYADSVSPRVNANGTGIFRNVAATVSISGVGADYFQVNGSKFISGIPFDTDSVSQRAQEAVIDQNTANTLFADGADPVGQVIIIARVPVRVIGLIENSTGFGPGADSLNVYVPYTTVMGRMLGQDYLSSISVRIKDEFDINVAQNMINDLLLTRHGRQDFFLQNTNTIRETITSTSQTMTLLISAIAVISLAVGGIGVMNIMLVSVTERTREIGVRMAIGARQSDIMQQFLLEAVLVCLVGGILGVALAFGIGSVASALSNIRLSYSPTTVIAALLSSSLIGIGFGFMPARSAARMNPVDALARE